MKQKWIMLACIATTLASWASNESNGTLEEQKDIKVIERYFGEDKRSMSYFPLLSHKGNIIYMYSAICFENMQVTILDESGETVYSDILDISENQWYTFCLSTDQTGTYTIELTNNEHFFWGQFLL